MILMIDNYDSFTYNLVQYLEELGEEVSVTCNDRIRSDEVRQLNPEAIFISPGPSHPDQAGVSIEMIQHFYDKIPIFGVCLGHQAIGCAFGGNVVVNYRLMHGKVSSIYHDGQSIYAGLPVPFQATRYHSLVIEPESLPDCLEVTARTDQGEIMGVRHRFYPVEGVQFHPESIMTPEGHLLLSNFMERARYWRSSCSESAPGIPMQADLQPLVGVNEHTERSSL